ncbi:protein DEK [Aplysia californica]|uniref:Protein DEK n=1 Tax=Aplysia californica TaxID=6500 RepID=A0ABM1A2Y4_APLCA|nr:protein DEK [Aplysia californica]
MADDENNAKPTEAKEEGETPKKEEAQNAVEQSPQKEASEPPDSSDDNADSPEKKESPSKEPPAKSPKKEVKKEEEDDEDEESDEEDEELPPGLLEQPLQVQGKRETKKVERLSASLVPNRPEKKKIQVEEGAGVKLGDIPYIENSLNKTKAIDLKPLHRILFFRPGSNMEIKKNLRQFSGVAQGKDSKDHARRMAALNKMVSAQLKAMCLVLGLERNGTKQDILDRLEEFILKPYDRGVKVPQPKTKKRSRSKTPSSKKAKKVKTKGVKKKKKTKEQVDDDDEEDEDDEKDNDEEEEEEDEPEEEEEEEESEEEEEEDEKDETGLITPAEGLMTPGGISSVPVGMETPDQIELRKRRIEDAMDQGGDTPALYQVLPEKKAAPVGGAMMGSAHVYDMTGVNAPKKPGDKVSTEAVEVSLNPEELDLDTAAMQAKYEQTVREQQSQLEKEDLSDMVAAHAAKQRKRKKAQQDTGKGAKKYKDFKF